MSPEPFQVLLVPFPFSDRLREKWRPAVVVSETKLWRETGVFWAAMITSSERLRLPGDVDISDVVGAGLDVACRVRTSKLATMTTRRISRRLGFLNARDREAVMSQLRRSLASVSAA